MVTPLQSLIIGTEHVSLILPGCITPQTMSQRIKKNGRAVSSSTKHIGVTTLGQSKEKREKRTIVFSFLIIDHFYVLCNKISRG